jgi:hypothetical protein
VFDGEAFARQHAGVVGAVGAGGAVDANRPAHRTVAVAIGLMVVAGRDAWTVTTVRPRAVRPRQGAEGR